MQYNEIKGIAKSISRYCWKKDAYHYQEFIERQAYKGASGGKKSKRGCKNDSERTLKPWEAMGISRATFYRRKMRPNKPKSDNSLSFGFDLCEKH
jgi:hypothetical protein